MIVSDGAIGCATNWFTGIQTEASGGMLTDCDKERARQEALGVPDTH